MLLDSSTAVYGPCNCRSQPWHRSPARNSCARNRDTACGAEVLASSFAPVARLNLVPSHVRHARRRPESAGSRLETGPVRALRELLRSIRTDACRPRQIPRNGTPARMRSISASRTCISSSARIIWPKWPTPGRMIFVASRKRARRREQVHARRRFRPAYSAPSADCPRRNRGW